MVRVHLLPFNRKENRHAKSQRLRIVGKTCDGCPVVSNVFHITSSQGLPLEIILCVLKEKRIVVDWTNFYDLAIKGGWKYKRIRERISSSVFEVYGFEYRDEVIRRLDKYDEIKCSEMK